jgi:Tfp pilus assembly protein PilX
MRARIVRDEGFALVFALLVCVVMTITVVSVISYTSSSSRSANVSSSRVSATHLAEAGIAEASSMLNQASNASDPTLLGCSTSDLVNSAEPCTDLTVTSDAGTTSFHGLYAQDTGTNQGTWTIVATGTVRNPTGASDLRKSMTATVTITQGGNDNNISIWNYLFATSPLDDNCDVDVTGQNITISVPLYVVGNLCLTGNNILITEDTSTGGQNVDVRVQGQLRITASGTGNPPTVGTSSAPITSGVVSNGCVTLSNPTPHTCTGADGWWVKNTDTLIAATAPVADWSSWYTNASPGPLNPCDAALTPSPSLTAAAFDNDTTQNGTNTAFNLTPSSSYNCVTSSGQLSWNSTTHLLNVSGTVFLDGDVYVSDTKAIYHGVATLYVGGKFYFSTQNAQLLVGCPQSPSTPTGACALSDATHGVQWDPNKDMLLIAAKGPSPAFDLSNQNNSIQAGLYCDQSATADFSGSNIHIEGPIICGHFNWGQNTSIVPLPTVTQTPPGAPVPPNASASISAPTITGG